MLDGSPDPLGRDNFEGERAAQYNVQERSAEKCAKMAGPIEIPSGLRTWVGPRNHGFEQGPDLRMGSGNFEEDGAGHYTLSQKTSHI